MNTRRFLKPLVRFAPVFAGTFLSIYLVVASADGGLTTPHAGALIHLHTRNMVPRFLNFYHEAVSKRLNPAQRWTLWKKSYGIAAVPPTVQGQVLAHKRLNLAWNHYSKIATQLSHNATRAEAAAQSILPQVANLLHSGKQPIDVNLVLFVGQFSGNAFTVPGQRGGAATVFLPVEMSFQKQRVVLAHEFTHAVHTELGNLKNGYLKPLGETALEEGLAMHASQHIVPGYATTVYTPADVYGLSWQKACIDKEDTILHNILPYLSSANEATIQRFIFGKGTVGIHDEVYCVGWVLVGGLLTHGHTYGDLVRIPEKEIPKFIGSTIRKSIPPTR